MKKNELVKLMQQEFDNGEELQVIYEKYRNEGVKEKTYVFLVASLKSNLLIRKNKAVNNILVVIMFISACFVGLLGYSIGIESGSETPIVWSSIALIPLLFMYGFIRVNHQAYLIYIILSISQLPKLVNDMGEYPIADAVGIVVSLSLIAFVWYVKKIQFPYMGNFGAKKDSNNQYSFKTSANKL